MIKMKFSHSTIVYYQYYKIKEIDNYSTSVSVILYENTREYTLEVYRNF